MNAFDIDLFLRIAPELFLKRAVVGGIERVFEINRNFRNEGADSTHSPEFAMLEAYQAYGDYDTMAALTQDLVQDAARDALGGTVVTLRRRQRSTTSAASGRRSRCTARLSEALGTEITPETTVDELVALVRRATASRCRPRHGEPRQARRGAVGAPRRGRALRADLRPRLPGRDQPADRETTAPIPGLVEKWDLYVRGVRARAPPTPSSSTR